MVLAVCFVPTEITRPPLTARHPNAPRVNVSFTFLTSRWSIIPKVDNGYGLLGLMQLSERLKDESQWDLASRREIVGTRYRTGRHSNETW